MTSQEPINERQQLFEAVKTKAVKCVDQFSIKLSDIMARFVEDLS